MCVLAAVKRRLQSKLESRKQLGHGDVAAKHGSQAGSDGDTASVGDLGGHSGALIDVGVCYVRACIDVAACRRC